MNGVLGILQARVSSRRLPGKVLEPVLGRPMLERQIERLRRARRLDEILIATSSDASDDALEQLAQHLGVACFRGSLGDVLDRFRHAAQSRGARQIARMTGDCPLADPELVDRVVDAHLEAGSDYTSNALERRWPDGLDVEVVRSEALEVAWREAELPSEREHVTPFLYKHPERFRIRSLVGAVDRSAMRWVVDRPADLEFVRQVYEELYPRDACFGTRDVLALLERRPELGRINSAIDTDEGWERSLEEDRAHLARES